MKEIIKKILMESDFEWAEETIEGFDPYKLRPRELIGFLNNFFQNYISPKFGRTYEVYEDYGNFIIRDETGNYYSESVEDTNLYEIIRELRLSMNSMKHDNVEISEEYKDLLDTLKPLTKGNINESDEFDWVDDAIDGDPYKMKPRELASFLDTYFKSNPTKMGLTYECYINESNEFIIESDPHNPMVAMHVKRANFNHLLDYIYEPTVVPMYRDIAEDYQDLYDVLKPLMRGDINESDEFEWAEDIIDNTKSPYDMDATELTQFLNQYFNSHPSPRFGRYYSCELLYSVMSINDNTGRYVSVESVKNNPFVILIDKLESIIDGYERGQEPNINETYLEYKDLYNTLKPLMRYNIREQANEFDWIDIDDTSEPKGIALATLIENYLKSNEFPFYVKVRKERIVLGNLETNFITMPKEDFTIDGIQSLIEEMYKIFGSRSRAYREYKELEQILKPLFDSLK